MKLCVHFLTWFLLPDPKRNSEYSVNENDDMKLETSVSRLPNI